MTGRAPAHNGLSSLLQAVEHGTGVSTLCEISRGVRLVAPTVAGIAAYQVLSGTLYLYAGGDEPQVARQGTLVLVPPDVRPELAADTVSPERLDGADCVSLRNGWRVADATQGRARDVLVVAARISGPQSTNLPDVVSLSVGTTQAGQQALTLLREEIARPDRNQAMGVSLLTTCILAAMRDAMAAENRPGDGQGGGEAQRDAQVARAVAAISDRPGEPYTLDSMADLAGMSRSTFARHFPRVTGTSPMEFLQNVRLKEAAVLLRTTALPVKTVAATSGFASRSHFSRAFRAQFGADPTAYRTIEPDR